MNLGIIPGSHMRSVYSINWSKFFTGQQDGKPADTGSDLIATGGADNRLNIYEINRESLQPAFQGQFQYNTVAEQNMAHLSDINCVTFGPSVNLPERKEQKTMLATCADDGLIKIWTVTIVS